MMQQHRAPFYFRVTLVLLGLALTVYILSVLGDIVVPLAFATIIAMLLNPLCNWLQQRGLPKIPAILCTLLVAVVVVAAVFFFLSSQIARFGESIPLLKTKLQTLLTELQHWLQYRFGISAHKQVQMINETLNSSKAMVGQTLGSLVGAVGILFLMPVYIFLLLFYKTLILNFLYEVFAEHHSEQVKDVLNETKKAVQSYMVGLLIEAVIIAVLNSTALLIIGVPYAILLGVIGALLNMLPYIGGIIAIALPVLMATVTSDGFGSQLAIIGAYAVIQFLDNNVIVPRIVSSKVKLNALASIITVLLGGALWGVPGMFLSIPFMAIIKIICDRVDELKPWGRLLGDDIPPMYSSSAQQLPKRDKPSVSEQMTDDVT